MVAVPIVLSMLLQVGVVQNYAVSKVTDVLTEISGAKFSISRVSLDFFTRATLEGVSIMDHRGDTMIYVKEMRAGIDGINFLTGKIALGAVTLVDGRCYLYKDSTGMMNVQSVFDHFAPKVPPPNPPDFSLSAREVNVINFHFKLDEYGSRPKAHGVNFTQLDLRSIHFQAREVNVFNYDIRLRIEHLTFRDKSGFTLQHLSTPQCGVNDTGLRLERLRVETNRSTLQFEHLYLLYDTWYAWNDFPNKVTLDANFFPSRLSFRTLGYFIDLPGRIPTDIEFEGRVRGAIPDLRGYLSNVKTRNTHLGVAFNVIGLPDVSKTKFELAVDHLTTRSEDIQAIYREFTTKSLDKNTAGIISRLGEIEVNGSFYGLLTDFRAKANVTTAQGVIDANLAVLPRGVQEVRLLGHVQTDNFNLGQTLGVKDLGRMVFDGDVDVRLYADRQMALTTKATLHKLQFAGYDFTGIAMDGDFRGKSFSGTVVSTDENLKFTGVGLLDFTGAVPDFDFRLQLDYANLNALGVNRRDSVSLLSARFVADGEGSTMDNVNGQFTIDSLLYINQLDTVRADLITITSQSDESERRMKMTSHFADIEFLARSNYSQIFDYLDYAVRRYLPVMPEAQELVSGGKVTPEKKNEITDKVYNNGFYQLQVNVKQANRVASIFIPGMELAEGTKLNFLFNPRLNIFNLNLNSDFIGRDKMYADSIQLSMKNVGDSLAFSLATSDFYADNLYLPEFKVRGGIRNNVVDVGVSFDNPKEGSMARLNTSTEILRTAENLPQARIDILPSDFAINGNHWIVSPCSFTIDSTGLDIRSVELLHENQRLAIDGKVGETDQDTVSVDLREFDISPLSILIKELGYGLRGHVSGNARGVSLLSDMQFNALLNLDDVMLNDYDLGDPSVFARWDAQKHRVNFGLMGDDSNMPVAGYYDVKSDAMKMDIQFPRFDMVLIEPLLQGIFVNTSGLADVSLVLALEKGLPILNGKIDIKEYQTTIDYTKARYRLSGLVDVVDNRFSINAAPLTDLRHGSGEVTAWLDSDHFQNLKFLAKVNFRDLLALNTTFRDNDIFFGTAYGNGSFEVAGDEGNTNMKIVAQTATGTEFYLPFTNIATIEQAEFVTFVDPSVIIAQDSTSSRADRFNTGIAKHHKRANELDIKIDLQVLPNTQAQISMVSTYVSNQIKGRGQGRFNMHINPTQNIFTMSGPFEIDKGSYQFNLGRVFDKWFDIEPGGSLLWTGDPANPDVNISAIYKVKASIEPLNLGGSNSGTVSINCGVNLSNKLFSPDIKLSITAPSANPEIQNALRNLLNTEEAVSMQFFSLFLANSFMPDMGTAAIGSLSSSLAGATGFEFLSNQLSSLISSEKYNIKFGYRPRTEVNAEEISADFSADIVENKLSIEVGGNYITSSDPSFNQRLPFTGEANATWTINKSGTLKARAFTRVIERFDETQGLQETGVGVYFRQDFQSLVDLKDKYYTWLNKGRVKRGKKPLMPRSLKEK